MTGGPRDLVVLAPGKNRECTLSALLVRHRSLGIGPVTADVYVHPERDPGCRERGHDFLRPFCTTHSHALLVVDLSGCGDEDAGTAELEKRTTALLRASGWGERAAALVVDPELEAWVWSDSPHVERCLEWSGRAPALRDWLVQEGLLVSPKLKPADPKAAVERALREARVPRSSSICECLAATVSLRRCGDWAFRRLVAALRGWFPPPPGRPQ